THFCLCSEGYYYHFSACLKGKTFPGKIAIKVSETVGLEDQTSLAYQGLYTEIVGFVSIFQLSFCISIPCSNTELRSVDASPSSSARSEVRAGDEVVTVTIVNILTLDTNGTQETVSALIKSAINGTNITDYILQDRCDYYGCVKAEDDCVNNLACTCKEGWERLNPQVAFCFASSPECPENCSGEHRRCLIKEDESPECACEPGYKEDDDGNSISPLFFSLSEFQLILTIVGAIAGVLILSMVIALIITARSRNKEKNIEEQNLIEEDFQNLRLRPTGFSNLGAQGRMFPKIRVAGSRDSLSPNPYAQADMPHPDY
uniref:Mucin 13, cell surface associated n=1 Tax=Prolemur simus TaxID=1328070 RepID=A0A8C8ZLC9_PROSS